ncbi:MAG: septal ring lytic transglycosylase RlpA family protein [Acidobacteria bacterium]|nr:septal ring lytic transglycosylase RlpA family protein [Acidobacteriota bacterium]
MRNAMSLKAAAKQKAARRANGRTFESLAGCILAALVAASAVPAAPRNTPPASCPPVLREQSLRQSPAGLSRIIRNMSNTGYASWYGGWFHGRRTANGETFDQQKLTAAHPTLPFGTKAKITNLKNERSVIVQINDRGPYKKGRILDLSRAAASQLGIIRSGVALVRIEVLPPAG